jgi:RNA polymerase sigma-70 factor (ECF subfamily)
VSARAEDDWLARNDASRAGEPTRKSFDRDMISDALNQLEPLHREVIRQAYYLGRTTGEIAAALDISEPVTKSQLHRAMHTVRLNLARRP